MFFFFFFFIVAFPCLPVRGVAALKFRRATQAFDKTIKIKKIKKSLPFSMHAITAVCQPCPAVTLPFCATYPYKIVTMVICE